MTLFILDTADVFVPRGFARADYSAQTLGSLHVERAIHMVTTFQITRIHQTYWRTVLHLNRETAEVFWLCKRVQGSERVQQRVQARNYYDRPTYDESYDRWTLGPFVLKKNSYARAYKESFRIKGPKGPTVQRST